MELTDILIDLSNSKAALEVANHTIRRMKGKCIRKNILIAGLLWFGFVSCKMVNEAEKQRKLKLIREGAGYVHKELVKAGLISEDTDLMEGLTYKQFRDKMYDEQLDAYYNMKRAD